MEDISLASICGVSPEQFKFDMSVNSLTNNHKTISIHDDIASLVKINEEKKENKRKLYQSILGYDLVLNNCILDTEYLLKMKSYFLKKCISKELNIEYLTAVTKSLIFGVFHSIDSSESKDRIWKFMKNI